MIALAFVSDASLLVDAGAVGLFVRCLGDMSRRETIMEAAGAALQRMIASGVPGRAAVIGSTPSLVELLRRDFTLDATQ